ncbi:MAG: hypothetical protein ABR985_14465 [Methanotrichaceae archaeon]|jgi:hypothetical protein
MNIQTISTTWELSIIILSPLIGALVGVYLGFRLDDGHRKELDDKKRLFFMILLLHEIDESIELLNLSSRKNKRILLFQSKFSPHI